MKNKKGFVGMGIIVAIVGILSVGSAAYYATKSKINEKENIVIKNTDSKTTSEEPEKESSTDVIGQYAYLINAYSENNINYIDVDYVQLLGGIASLQAQVEDGQCPNTTNCYDMPNGYKRNQNPLIRTFQVANNSNININGLLLWKKVVPPLELTYANSQDPYWTSGDAYEDAMDAVNRNITFTEFENLVSQVTSNYPYNPPFQAPKTFIKINVENNMVTDISEPYQE